MSGPNQLNRIREALFAQPWVVEPSGTADRASRSALAAHAIDIS